MIKQMGWRPVNTVEWCLLIFITFHVLMGVLLALFNLPYFIRSYTLEDGVLEWFGFDALLASAFLSFYRARVFWTSQRISAFFLHFFLGLLMLFGAGEEISWGQRLFNLSIPEFFVIHNSQGEINLHNLVFQGKKINKLFFGTFLGIGVGFYFAILPFWYHHNEKLRQVVRRWELPLPRGLHLVAFFLLFCLVQLIPSGKKGEVLEFGGTSIFFLTLLFPLNAVTGQYRSGE